MGASDADAREQCPQPILAQRHWFRVAVVAPFVLVFVISTTSTGENWWNVVRGAVIGLFLSLTFAFGDELADALERRKPTCGFALVLGTRTRSPSLRRRTCRRSASR
jgi:hypothetical protein